MAHFRYYKKNNKTTCRFIFLANKKRKNAFKYLESALFFTFDLVVVTFGRQTRFPLRKNKHLIKFEFICLGSQGAKERGEKRVCLFFVSIKALLNDELGRPFFKLLSSIARID